MRRHRRPAPNFSRSRAARRKTSSLPWSFRGTKNANIPTSYLRIKSGVIVVRRKTRAIMWIY